MTAPSVMGAYGSIIVTYYRGRVKGVGCQKGISSSGGAYGSMKLLTAAWNSPSA